MSDLILVIGNKNYSSWSLRPWILMKHLGLDFQERLVPLFQSGSAEEIKKYTPAGKVPVLKRGEVHVWDSLAICEYLSELTGRVLPKDPEARAVARCVCAEMHSGFSNLRNAWP
jgi:glutathione S-transferase